ncbi:MAG: transcription termination/antitermination protein NusG [Thermoguttaceae bacterium]
MTEKETQVAASESHENSSTEEPATMQWYILKVQVNREDTIKRNIQRRIDKEGMNSYFGRIHVPIEKVKEIRGGKPREVKRKLYPGYVMIEMVITMETWFLVRETPGVGDFTGTSAQTTKKQANANPDKPFEFPRPTPMLPHEVQRMLASEADDTTEVPKLKVGYEVGALVKVKEGTFENYEGTVESIDLASGRVTVVINLFGRSTPVELEYWQIVVEN